MSLNNSIVTQSIGVPYQQYITSSAGHTLVSSSTYFNDTSDNIPRYKDANGVIYDAIISSSYSTTSSYALTSLSSSYSPSTPPFPFTGDASITGSLTISGSLLNTGTVSIDDTDSPYTITGTQQFILIDPSGGDVTVNMPDASTYPGREVKFKLTQAAGANTVTLQRQGSDTIDGATTYTDLDIQYESISTTSNGGTGWFIF